MLYQLSYLAKKTPEPFGAGGWVGSSPGATGESRLRAREGSTTYRTQTSEAPAHGPASEKATVVGFRSLPAWVPSWFPLLSSLVKLSCYVEKRRHFGGASK